MLSHAKHTLEHQRVRVLMMSAGASEFEVAAEGRHYRNAMQPPTGESLAEVCAAPLLARSALDKWIRLVSPWVDAKEVSVLHCSISEYVNAYSRVARKQALSSSNTNTTPTETRLLPPP
jgi:hypothetical protein